MVRLKQSWVLREGNTPGFPSRVSVSEQLGQLPLGGTADQSVTAMPSMLLLGTAHFAGTPSNGITLG